MPATSAPEIWRCCTAPRLTGDTPGILEVAPDFLYIAIMRFCASVSTGPAGFLAGPPLDPTRCGRALGWVRVMRSGWNSISTVAASSTGSLVGTGAGLAFCCLGVT